MDRIVSAIAFLAFSLFLMSGELLAAEISVRVDVEASSIRVVEEDGRIKVDADGMNQTSYFEFPSLPWTTVSVILPQGNDVLSFRLEGGETIELSPSVQLAPFEGLLRNDGTVSGLSITMEDATGDGSLFPASSVRYVGTSRWKGFTIASFEVYPVRYDLSSGRLTLDSGVTLVVETAPSFVEDVASRLRHVDGFRAKAMRDVMRVVDNPDEARSYSFSDIVVDESSRGFSPAYQPGLEGSAVSYLIVTNEEMAAEFQRLADSKTLKGVPAVVRTIEWIEANYWSGADLGETIRNFIKEAYGKWGVEYVLLGGDTDVVPERYGYTTFDGGWNIPTDMYYSCLDGNWNADGDSLWGEAYHSALDPGDYADLYAEVYIGRLCASTVDDANVLIDKTLEYEEPADTIYKRDFLFLGEVVFPPTWDGTQQSILLDGADLIEPIYELYFKTNSDVDVTRLYENYTIFPGTGELTLAASIAELNLGSNHVIHVGHGSKYSLSVGDASILNFDAYNLTNGMKTFSMYLLNCTNVAFDTNCLAEYFMLNPGGGAFAITGASRPAYPSSSSKYMSKYYDLLFADDVLQLGKLFAKSREPFTPGAFGETSERYTHFIYSYLGDPEINMYRKTGGTFDVTTPAVLAYGLNEVIVEVSSEGVPFDSAYVCLYKDDDDYVHGYTNVSGEITFSDFLCRDSGVVTVTVTGIDHCRHTSTIDVDPEVNPYLRVNGHQFSDPMGNGDGKIDSGETIELSTELLNTGQAGAEKLWAEIAALHPSVTMIDSISLYPDIVEGGAEVNLTAFEFSINTSVPDETPIEFVIEIHDSMGGYWSEQFAFEVHAPELELYINTVSDEVPYGDGNGEVGNGEGFLLRIGVKNFGTGTAYGLQGKIRAEDSGITVSDSTSDYSDLELLETGSGEGFVLSEADVMLDNHFTFELTDNYGRIFTKRMELRNPGIPHTITLDASLAPDQIQLTWHSPDTLEVYKYLVSHSMNQGGPYEQVSTDLVIHMLFRDRNLLSSTIYYFIVEAVDTCGNVGEASVEMMATTNPPQLTGWPNQISKESSSSPKIADIDGDNRGDVVIGAEYVYAWDGNGMELRDGDGQPLTWGIFNTEGDNYTATVALGELDEVPGAEIVAASWNTKEIFVFTHDGSTLPGWPKTTVDLCWASPVISDFDGDGDFEVIAYDLGGIVYVWHHDGTELMDGDGNPLTDGPFFAAGLPSHGWHMSTPALADIDNDGIAEIVVASPQDSIYCLNSDRSAVSGWPVFIGDSTSGIGASPVVGDIDGDSFQEVVLPITVWSVLGLNHDGTSMSGWPLILNTFNSFAGSCALADFTGDGKLEVVIPGMDGYCWFFRYDGSQMPGWPQAYATSGPTESSPTIADITGDGSLEIILGGEEGRLNAWDINGNDIPGFPIQLTGYIRGTPIVKDLDIDGDIELVAACWDQNVYVWDLEATTYYGYDQWNGFHGDQFNSGWKEIGEITDASISAWMYELGSGFLKLTWAISGDADEWDLYRRSGDGDFEMVAAALRIGETGSVSFTDMMIEEGLTYVYKLEVAGGGVSVETDPIEVPIVSARLYQNHPNPFNPVTTIAFTVPGGSISVQSVHLNVYDVRGALVKTLINGPVTGGRHEVKWNGLNNRGEQVASGVYFAKFASGGYRSVRKMVLLR